jgi:hypothetical protein
MRTRLTRYFSEVVSLTMMALFIIALASGQAAGGDVTRTPHAMAASNSFSVRHEGE